MKQIERKRLNEKNERDRKKEKKERERGGHMQLKTAKQKYSEQ